MIQNGGLPFPGIFSFFFSLSYFSLISNVRMGLNFFFFMVVGKDFFCLWSIVLTDSFGQFPFSPSKDCEMFTGTKAPSSQSGVCTGGQAFLGGGCGLFPFVPGISDLTAVSPKSSDVADPHTHSELTCWKQKCVEQPSWFFVPSKLFGSPSAGFSFHTS